MIEKNEYRQKQLFKQLQKSDTQGEKESDRPPKKKMKPGDRIPKKQKPDGESKASPPSKSSAKLCQNCAKWALAIKNTHNTAQCLKFKADGLAWTVIPTKH